MTVSAACNYGPHTLMAKKQCRRPDRETDRDMDIRTHKCIAMLDPQTGNVFVLISSVGVQCHDAFFLVQKGPRTNSQTDIKSQKACGQPDRRTAILYCAERNYELHK